MAALNFPSSPSLYDFYTVGGQIWMWNGASWQLITLPPFLYALGAVSMQARSSSTGIFKIGAELASFFEFYPWSHTNAALRGFLQLTVQRTLGSPDGQGPHYMQWWPSGEFQWSGGKFVLNSNASGNIGHQGLANFELVSEASSLLSYLIDSYGFSGNITFRRAGGSYYGTKSALASGNIIGAIAGRGYGTSSYSSARVRIDLVAAEAWTNSAQGTEVVVNTTPTGSTTMAEAVRIKANGALQLTKGQLQFPATQNASSDVNCLDDYEEGTWTPTVGGTATYTANFGNYTKIGHRVVFEGQIVINVIGTGSTNTISGLPFTCGAYNGHMPISYWDNSATNYASLTGYIPASGSQALVMGVAAGGAATVALANYFKAGSNILFWGSYTV